MVQSTSFLTIDQEKGEKQTEMSLNRNRLVAEVKIEIGSYICISDDGDDDDTYMHIYIYINIQKRGKYL